MGGATRTFQTYVVSFVLEDVSRNTSCPVEAFTTTSVTGDLRAVDWRRIAPNWAHLKQLPFHCSNAKKTVDLLIGVDQAPLHIARKKIRGKAGSLSDD